MEEKISKSKYLTITAFLLLILISNLLVWKSPIVGVSFGLAYLAFFSLISGSIFIAKKGWHLILGLVFLLSIISIAGTGAIYFYQFNDIFFIILLAAIPALLITPYYRIKLKEKLSFRQAVKKYMEHFSDRQEPKINFALAISYLFIAAFAFLFLADGQTLESIQSPWQVVTGQFFLFYFLGSAVLLTYLFNAQRTKLPLLLIVIHAMLSTSVALVVYGVGFGFDPFIHQAAEKIILATGTISPTPLYYLGQYSIVIFLSKLMASSHVVIDRLLVPLLASIVLPVSTFYVFSHWVKKNYALVISLLMLVIPYTSFIMTTPQNLANLFFIFTILLSLLYFRNQIKIEILYLLALATFVIHPIAGIPLLITIFLFNLFKLLFSSYTKYISLFFLTASVFIIVMPMAFIANGSGIGSNIPNPQAVILNFFTWIDKFDLPLNIAYLVDFNKALIATVIILLGVAYLANHKLVKNNAAYFVAALVIFLNFLITKYFITFPDIRDFDQNEFTNRLLTLTFYVLLPFFLLGLHWIIKRFWQKELITKIFLIFILSGALTVSLYLSYPSLDQFKPAKFFSLSIHDIRAVDYIEKTADPQHIVLANQMVGAAAIKTVGFKQYYADQFFYSMPMGSPRTFYDYYLDIVEDDNVIETISKAMNEADVEEVYFVINKYWRGSENIVAKVRQTADAMYTVEGGQVHIFKYTKQRLNER